MSRQSQRCERTAGRSAQAAYEAIINGPPSGSDVIDFLCAVAVRDFKVVLTNRAASAKLRQ
jgi:hypothetical protein